MRFWTLLLLISALSSCRKDEPVLIEEVIPDFRMNYVGTYEMYIHSYHWQLGNYEYWQEETAIGKVFIYDFLGDSIDVMNIGQPFESEEELSSGITIMFKDSFYNNCYVRQNDTIRPYATAHYKHIGYFTDDSLYFDVTGLGGQGGGSDYFTKGRKLD